MLTDPFSSSKITAYLAVIYRDLHIQVWITFEKKMYMSLVFLSAN